MLFHLACPSMSMDYARKSELPETHLNKYRTYKSKQTKKLGEKKDLHGDWNTGIPLIEATVSTAGGFGLPKS